MMLVNNGKYRRTTLEFKRTVNGSPVFTGGFPFSVSILNAFAEFPSLTEEQFVLMSDTDYLARLNAFYQYLRMMYPFFTMENHVPDISDINVNSHGDDTDSCPVDLTPFVVFTIRLEVEYFVSGSVMEAVIRAIAVDFMGNRIPVPQDVEFSFVLKEAMSDENANWDSLQGTLVNSVIAQGTSETLLVERFQFRGEPLGNVLYKSVYVSLFDIDEESGFTFSNPKTVSITVNLPAFLLNFISNLNTSFQDRLTQLQVGEIASSGKNMFNSGKQDLHFEFMPNVAQRPVLIYPASWGPLSEVVFVQGNNINIINDGVFQLDNGNPYQVTLDIDGASVNYFVYSASNLIIYPYKVDYIYRF